MRRGRVGEEETPIEGVVTKMSRVIPHVNGEVVSMKEPGGSMGATGGEGGVVEWEG